MSAQVRLLGVPRFAAGEESRAMPGRKPWALLGYLALESQPPSRRQAATLLCPEAEDPLAALRWTLLQLRRGIDGLGEVVDDGRLHLHWRPNVLVDVDELLGGRVGAEAVADVVIGDLLEGVEVASSAFDLWLTLQRSRVTSAAADALRWAAAVLAPEQPEHALEAVRRALTISPFDDALHELAVDIQVQRNDVAGAEAYAAQVARQYRDELGTEAPASLRRPLQRAAPQREAPLLSLDMAARHLLDMADRRFAAGDYDGALETARHAAERASQSGDTAVEARALTALAYLLIHSMRGRDAEAQGLLNRALQLARVLDDAATLSDVEREIGYSALLQARYGAAEAALERAQAQARRAGDDGRLLRAQVYQALALSDRCEYAAAETSLRAAVDALDAGGTEPALAAYTRAALARVLVLTGRLDEGLAVADASVAAGQACGAVAMLPWAMVWSAEALRRRGDLDAAKQRFGESYTLGCEVADPCWEALALRGIAALEVAAGDHDRARAILGDAVQRVRRHDDVYQWAHAAVLTDLIELEGGADPAHLAAAVDLVRSAPMPDFMARLAAVRPELQTPAQTPAS